MARPTKLTPEVKERISQAILMGATYELAAQYGGISYDTFNEWMKRGLAETEGEFYEFYEAIKSAEGKAVVGWLAKIEKAATAGNWQAAAWKLERRYPKDYGRQIQQTTNLNVDLSNLTDEQLQRIAAGDDPASVLSTTQSGNMPT